jgi:hypothetical protein
MHALLQQNSGMTKRRAKSGVGGRRRRRRLRLRFLDVRNFHIEATCSLIVVNIIITTTTTPRHKHSCCVTSADYCALLCANHRVITCFQRGGNNEGSPAREHPGIKPLSQM